MNLETEYAVELECLGDYAIYFKRVKRTFLHREDAEWLAKYYWCWKGRKCRVVQVTTKPLTTEAQATGELKSILESAKPGLF